MCLEQATLLLSAVIGGGMFYIGWQQWKTNKQRLKLEQYDRRLRIYNEIVKFLSGVLSKGKAHVDDLVDFRAAVSESDFLFEEEITDYINDIFKHGMNYWMWNEKYEANKINKLDGYDNEKVTNEMAAELKWLTDQFHPTKEKFQKYLNLSK